MTDALVGVTVDGQTVLLVRGSSVIAAVTQIARAAAVTRRSVSGAPRGPLCGMGVCQECRVTIDSRPHRLACQTLCADGMTVCTGGAQA